MEYLLQFLSHPVVAVILLLGILILAHELGHYIVGKICGIGVEIFSVGFGPVLASFQYGETNYRFSLIPLGGYVKYYGSTRIDEVPAEIRGREFHSSALWKRMLAIGAGPFCNFFLAVIAYTGMGMYGMPQLPAIVGEIMSGSPAEKAGMQFLDRVINIAGKPIKSWRDLQEIIGESPSSELKIKVERAGKQIDLTIVPESIPSLELVGPKQRGRIGIAPDLVPSFVSITDYSKLGATIGLKTGDRIVGVKSGDVRKEIKYWREFLIYLSQAVGEKKAQIEIEVRSFSSPKETDPSQKDSMWLVIPLGQVEEGDSLITTQRCEELFGLTHSQLTVLEIDYRNKEMHPEGNKFSNRNEPATDSISDPELGRKVEDAVMPFDRILKWNDQRITNVFEFGQIAATYSKPSVSLQIQRHSELLDIVVSLEPVEFQKAEGKVTYYRLPVRFLGETEQPEPILEQYDFIPALSFGLRHTLDQTQMIGMAVIGLITGDVPLKALGGPIAIGAVASESVRMGWMTFFSALALISINFALLNLLPIPILDGGQLMLLFAEFIHRRPLPEIAIENFQKIGFVIVLALVIMATYNDLSRFWTAMLRGILGFFQ